MLTPNQAILLRKVCGSAEPVATSVLAKTPNSRGASFGEDACRSAMSRLEKRGLVARTRAGLQARWSSTPEGHELLVELDGSSNGLDPDSSPGKGRPYIVFEEVSLADAVREALGDASTDTFEAFLAAIPDGKHVYDEVAKLEARNAEHAYRQAAKDIYGDVDAEPLLVAVATKMFQPTRVRVRNRQTVSLG